MDDRLSNILTGIIIASFVDSEMKQELISYLRTLENKAGEK